MPRLKKPDSTPAIKLPKLSIDDQIRIAGLPTVDDLKRLASENARGLVSYEKGRGRMTVMTQTAILEAVERGHNMHIAAAIAGVNHNTIKNWLLRGAVADIDDPFGKFAIEYKRAEGRSQEILLERIADTGRDDWRAYAWLLSRRYREWNETAKPTIEQQEELHELKVSKARAEIDLIRAKTDKLLNQEGDPVQELLGILAGDTDLAADESITSDI
jgi:hypothetical protein